MNRLLALVLVAAALAAPLSGAAKGETYREISGQFSVYLTVMPSEIVRGPLPEELPGAAPQRAPAARDTHHVVVAIFDTASRMRVESFNVRARVAVSGLSGVMRDLEPASIAGQAIYAGSFPMLGRGPFRVDVEFQPHRGTRRHQATFYFTHPAFAESEERHE